MEAWYRSIGCVLKTLADVCELNHWSHEELLGRKFKPFGCRWCDYTAKSRKQWLADVEAHAQLDEKARHDADVAHNRVHLRHNPFDPPTFHLDAW